MVDSPRLPTSRVLDNVWSRGDVSLTDHEMCLLGSPRRQVVGSVSLEFQFLRFGSIEEHITVELRPEDIVAVQNTGVKVS